MERIDDKIDYDYDIYGNRIRKFVKVGTAKEGKDRKSIWKQDENYVPETGCLKERINRIVKKG